MKQLKRKDGPKELKEQGKKKKPYSVGFSFLDKKRGGGGTLLCFIQGGSGSCSGKSEKMGFCGLSVRWYLRGTGGSEGCFR